MPYLRTMLASVTLLLVLLLVFAFPAWGQGTTSTASPTPAASSTPTAQETTTGTTTGATTGTTTAGNVTLCHKGTETITVDASAKETHLAHGDSLGPCEKSGIPKEKIIDIPNRKVLVNTGGPSLLLFGVGAALLCFAGAAILMRLLRR